MSYKTRKRPVCPRISPRPKPPLTSNKHKRTKPSRPNLHSRRKIRERLV